MSDVRWSGADDYDWYVGRWSRAVATRFLAWVDVAPASRWIDVGCGTGALTSGIVAACDPAGVLAVDPSGDFVGRASAAVRDERVTFSVGSADALPAVDSSVDAVVSGLVLTFVPDPDAGVREAVRVARPGGCVGAYVWDYAERMDLMRRFWDAAATVDPVASEKDEGRRFSLANPTALERLWRRGGLKDVAVAAIDVPTIFRDFDDYWGPFLTGVGAAPAYAVTLDPERLAAVRERLRSTLPSAPDGTISLTARAWAVRGRRPG
jgi:SAM-dependent methyltransferase